MENNLTDKLSLVSQQPGVYLMKDAHGDIIYIGKAKNLKNRLSSYFMNGRLQDPKTRVLVKNIADIETIVTATANEALILEATLIRKHKPRYNIFLKDDKRFPSLRLDARADFPNLTIVRKTKNDGARYFGPYSSPNAVHRTLKMIHKTFKLRKCNSKYFKSRTRPCLNYQMGLCLGPCCIDVPKADYEKIVKEVIMFLKGQTPALIQDIKSKMMAAAENREYETAASLRDKMFALQSVFEKQVSVTADFMDRDVLGIARSYETCMITLLYVRGGYLQGSRHYSFDNALGPEDALIETFLRQYYEKDRFIPKEILIPTAIENADIIEAMLKEKKERKVVILRPERGEKARLIKMAIENAANALKDHLTAVATESDRLERLRKRLHMGKAPVRIECFDNSNIFGAQPVSGMVVFTHGKPDKSAYRKYKIKSAGKPDDYAAMAEILKRRFTKKETEMPFPDLLMVDGGKGQLNIAVAVLKELQLDGKFNVIGIAKKDEKLGETEDKIYIPGRSNPILFGKEKDLLFFLQRIRDEAHRFAITFHRKQRSKASVNSILDSVPGIGKKRKIALIKHFGSVKKIREATIEELTELPGITPKIAENLHQTLVLLPSD